MLPRLALRHQDGERHALWFCPACQAHHEVPLRSVTGWILHGPLDEPTILPTVIVTRRRAPDAPPLSTCHSRIKAGSIEYLPASTHALAGQTVAMEPA